MSQALAVKVSELKKVYGEEELCLDDEEQHKKKFEELILGYLKIYESKYGGEELEELLEGL